MNNHFSFINKTKQKIPSRYFLFTLENFLKKMKIKNPVEVNLILVGRARIQRLNYIYRKKNKPTNVLSFPIDITDSKQLKAKSQKLILGDIYICPQEVPDRELQNTFLHGLIHLIGYDHEKNEKEWEKVLKKINT
ncbi:MAG TPA: rRNA maturation RNase YbeY [Patescibacteria group bacterium]|nr:rRNA maturation RNase YbeY [Patescibacteria group bacterium]